MLFITFITSCKTSSIKIWLVLTAGLAETLTQVVFRQPFVIQCVRTWFASCETWHFLFLYFFITIQSTSDLWCCCISSCCIRVIWWFELQKCMVKPYHTINPITLWEPVYDIFVPRFQPENSSFRLPYQRHSSSANCTKELFKGSNGSACLLVCTWKKFFGWGWQIFLSDAISEVVLGPFWLMFLGLGPNQSVLAKVFCWSFHWKLGSSPSFLSLWSTF